MDLILQNLSPLGPKPSGDDLGKWITEKQAQDITGKKASTLWKMRCKGLLAFTKFNNKVFYDKESIMNLMDANRQDAFKVNTASANQNNKRA
ncbi:MAG: helix-turn-helix domain-containing protein [Saprospiraceae bacterium]|nr:helix-turn-helix domain-containing protein [Saprospiraceae bacterium]